MIFGGYKTGRAFSSLLVTLKVSSIRRQPLVDADDIIVRDSPV